MKSSRLLSALVVSTLVAAATPALAVQYPTLDPNYNQQIYTGPLVGGPGMAWTPTTNHLLTRNGSDILEYSGTQNTVHEGTNLHGTIATHTVTGLNSSGYGMTNGLDGYIYAVTGTGLQRFDPSNWASSAQTLTNTPGMGYGVTTLPDGRIAYSDGYVNSTVYIYDPVNLTNTPIYTATGGDLIDGMVSGPTGNLALAIQSNSKITIIANTGTVVNSFATAHFPDGLAFASTITSDTLYSNNNDGTITRYVLGPGYSGIPVTTDIATGSGAYGDLAAVGPDCAFYVSQSEHGSYHGASPGYGTNWDNNTTNPLARAEPSITRISGLALSTDGSAPIEDCFFYTPLETLNAPEPTSLALLGLGGLGLLTRRRARR